MAQLMSRDASGLDKYVSDHDYLDDILAIRGPDEPPDSADTLFDEYTDEEKAALAGLSEEEAGQIIASVDGLERLVEAKRREAHLKRAAQKEQNEPTSILPPKAAPQPSPKNKGSQKTPLLSVTGRLLDPKPIVVNPHQFFNPCFPKLYLHCPLTRSEREKFLRLGAFPDPEDAMRWILPARPNHGLSAHQILGFELDPLELELKQAYLVYAQFPCWCCHRRLFARRVIGKGLVDRTTTGPQRHLDEWVITRYVRRIAPEGMAAIAEVSGLGGFQVRESRTAGFPYYMELCPSCGKHQGDHPQVEQKQGAFCLAPDALAQAEKQSLGPNFRFCGWYSVSDRPLRHFPDLLAPLFGRIRERLSSVLEKKK